MFDYVFHEKKDWKNQSLLTLIGNNIIEIYRTIQKKFWLIFGGTEPVNEN